MNAEGHRIFEKSWAAVVGRMEGYFYRNECPPDDVKDLLQETASRAWKNFHTLKGDFEPWVFCIAKYTYIDYIEERKRRKSGTVNVDPVSSSSETEDHLIKHILLRQCLEGLDPLDRNCLILHDSEGYDFKKISEKLGISRSNAHYHVDKARNELREKFYGSEKVLGKAMKSD